MKMECCLKRPRVSEKNRGFALIATLGVMSVLAVLAWSFVYETRMEIKIASWRRAAQTNYYAARAGVHRVCGVILEHWNESANGSGSAWMHDQALYKNVRFAVSTYDITPFCPEAKDRDEGYGMIDEESLLNINVATPEMLMQFDGITSVLAEDILIYRARATIERRDDQVKGKSVTGPIQDISELLEIRGITRELLLGEGGSDSLGRNITCHSSGKVNVNTATPMTLTSLGFDPGEVESVLEYRRAGNDNFESVDAFFNDLGIGKERFGKVISLLTVKSSHYRMCSRAASDDGRAGVTIEARFDMNDDASRFSLWRVVREGIDG